MSDISVYGRRNVFWGREHPVIYLYDSNNVLIDRYDFTSYDNYRMEVRCSETLDGKNEMEDGMIRKRVRGYRPYFDFSISNLENRDLLLFLRKMWTADRIVIAPHSDGMRNPIDQGVNFEVNIDSDFDPRYLDGRFIGHEIPFTLESVYLLNEPPRDESLVQIILATTYKSGGVTYADRQTSVTYWGEKMWYGGWELTEDDFVDVAFWDVPEDVDEICDYGKLW